MAGEYSNSILSPGSHHCIALQTFDPPLYAAMEARSRRSAYIAFHAAVRRMFMPPASQQIPRRALSSSSSAATMNQVSSTSSTPSAGHLGSLIASSLPSASSSSFLQSHEIFEGIPIFQPSHRPQGPPQTHKATSLTPTKLSSAATPDSIEQSISAGHLLQAMSQLRALVTRYQKATSLLPSSDESLRNGRLPRPKIHLPTAGDFTRWAFDIHNRCKSNAFFDDAALEYKGGKVPAWRPSQLPSSIEVQNLTPDVFASFALASIFDYCLALGYVPEDRLCSVVFTNLGKVITSPQHYEEVVNFGMERLRPVKGSQDRKSIDLPVASLSAAIVGFGRQGNADAGEHLLARTVMDHLRAFPAVAVQQVDGLDLPLNGWAHDPAIWNSLVRSRCIAHDIQGAKRWFRLYRSICGPNLSSDIYLTLMDGIMSENTVGTSKLMSAETQRVVRSLRDRMRQDGVAPSQAMVNFLVDFERRATKKQRLRTTSRHVEARQITAQVDWDGHAYRHAFDSMAEMGTSNIRQRERTATLRRLLAALLRAVARTQKQRGKRISASVTLPLQLHSTLLQSALVASIRCYDFAAATLVCQLYGRFQCHIDEHCVDVVRDELRKTCGAGVLVYHEDVRWQHDRLDGDDGHGAPSAEASQLRQKTIMEMLHRAMDGELAALATSESATKTSSLDGEADCALQEQRKADAMCSAGDSTHGAVNGSSGQHQQQHQQQQQRKGGRKRASKTAAGEGSDVQAEKRRAAMAQLMEELREVPIETTG